ncbi:MAG: hypothetical protein NC313_10430 [Butyrivibrio sp.]|nr:hypothetical protein [Butyrivibrio sp.]
MDLGAIGYNRQDYAQAAGRSQAGAKTVGKSEAAEHTDFSLKYVQAQEDSDRNKNNESDSETESEIIVRADGSKVLMMTTHIGGAETMMSIQISGPAELQNSQMPPRQDESIAVVAHMFK